MKKNNCILTTILLLGLTFGSFNSALADNNLVQLDLKKGDSNAVDMTFFTSENYGSNVIVRKKSDNKYVILMPNVLTSGYRSADLSSVRDLITNIDVKSVNDGAAGYTKITIITTKPLNITTHVSQAEPLSEAQKEYRTLLAEAYTVKDNVNQPTTPKSTPRTEVTVNKTSQQNTTTPEKGNATVKQPEQKPEIKLTPIDAKKLVSPKPENSVVAKVKETVQAAQNNQKELPEVPRIEPTQEKPTAQATDESIQDIIIAENLQTAANHSHKSFISKLKTRLQSANGKVNQTMPAGLITTFIFLLVPLIGLIVLIKLISSSLKTSKALKQSFLECISQQPEPKDYEHIITNENLNWQEKYQLFINQTKTDNSTSNPVDNTNKYKFIQTTNNLEEQRQKLEKLVTPEKTEERASTPVKSEDVKVYQEENAIVKDLKETAKLKAFDASINEAKRNIPKLKKSRFTRFATQEDYMQDTTGSTEFLVKPERTVNLKKSLLTTGKRTMQNANLKVQEVKKDDYLMSSVEEFFATPETSVADTLAQIKPSMQISNPALKEDVSNPIEVNKPEKTPAFNGLIVKSGCNINEDRGFYIVNLDGTSALVGRIREEIFVLKKFNDISDKHLQIRHDKDNIYMVKTDGFKSLVDVSNMGVLIEL